MLVDISIILLLLLESLSCWSPIFLPDYSDDYDEKIGVVVVFLDAAIS